jgi:hypothetical protein
MSRIVDFTLGSRARTFFESADPSVKTFLVSLAKYEQDRADDPEDVFAITKLKENGVPDCWPDVATLLESFAVAKWGAAMLERFADPTLTKSVRDLVLMLLKAEESVDNPKEQEERQAFRWTVAQKLLLEHLPLIKGFGKAIASEYSSGSVKDEIGTLRVTKLILKCLHRSRDPSAPMAKELDAEAMKKALDAFLEAEKKKREAEAKDDLPPEQDPSRQWRKNAADAFLQLERVAAERIFGNLGGLLGDSSPELRDRTLKKANSLIAQAETAGARRAEQRRWKEKQERA